MIAHDLYAGLGGTTSGIVAAGGMVTHAANHSEPALDLHQRNHPTTNHHRQNLVDTACFNWARPDVGFASPSCKWFTRANGGRMATDHSRGTAWAVLTYAEDVRPPLLVVENVPEFMGWPCFNAWELGLQDLGYSLARHQVNAVNCGVPQNRNRMFVIGTQSKKPLHLEIPKRETRNARDYINLDTSAGRWSLVADKVVRTRKKANEGRRRFGDQFLICYYSSGSGKTGRSLDRPIGTIPAADVWAVVCWPYMRMLTTRELANLMGFPVDYQLAGTRELLTLMIGNAVCPPVAEEITKALMRQA